MSPLPGAKPDRARGRRALAARRRGPHGGNGGDPELAALRDETRDLAKSYGRRGDEKVVTSDIQDREGILPSIKSFLGKGR
jgi:hypothetical protein